MSSTELLHDISGELSEQQFIQLIEAAIFSASKPLSVKQLKEKLFVDFSVSNADIRQAIEQLTKVYQARGIELVEVASGFRFQVKSTLAKSIGEFQQERTVKYSRAILETLALVAYKQPITRGEIEDIRGVSVSSHIIKTLVEREWIKVVGHKEVPGRPAMYATTNAFLDYFSLTSLAQLPELMPMSESAIVTDAMQDIIAPHNDTQSNETETKR
ncbi:segregation and condensation protein B [Thalassotalea insulae]|uniref:Segregation and condensation protein B n=1 Tax=Thalassotalea insulae TaxID=2056778 RepID=A0ABQ6GZC3_9GAMM|nr:SMC-Scp complex subunit ScpB [Thalassotalea insulae]GLX79840.1 segregation and condensation protein B [Thalassotalea insulae]